MDREGKKKKKSCWQNLTPFGKVQHLNKVNLSFFWNLDNRVVSLVKKKREKTI